MPKINAAPIDYTPSEVMVERMLTALKDANFLPWIQDCFIESSYGLEGHFDGVLVYLRDPEEPKYRLPVENVARAWLMVAERELRADHNKGVTPYVEGLARAYLRGGRMTKDTRFALSAALQFAMKGTVFIK